MNEHNFWNELRSGKFASMVKETSKGQALSNSQDVYNVMKPMFAEQDDVESLFGIFLDAKNKVVGIEKLFSGSLTGSMVYPREIIKRILSLKAAAFVMVHNHPSGNPQPSPEDRQITLRVLVALKSIGVSFHDHIIVGDGWHSMRDRNEMSEFEKIYKNCLEVGS